jgi:hypothetical protein
MLAGLLYLIGLVTVLVNIAIAGYRVPAAVTQFTAAMDAATSNMVDESIRIAAQFGSFVWPVLIGLALMGFGRVIMLLGSINRSLRGQS